MKREEIKALLPDISDEALSAILNINGKDIEKAKGNTADLQTQLDSVKADLDKANGTIAALETAKGDAEALQAEIDKYKQAEADRKLAEEQNAAEQVIMARFDAVKPTDKKFLNDYTLKGIYGEFKSALGDEANRGKSDRDIFDTITKDRDLYINPNKPGDIPGIGDGSGDPKPSPNRFF